MAKAKAPRFACEPGERLLYCRAVFARAGEEDLYGYRSAVLYVTARADGEGRMVIGRLSLLRRLALSFLALVLWLWVWAHDGLLAAIAGLVIAAAAYQLAAWRGYLRGAPILFACPISAIQSVTLRRAIGIRQLFTPHVMIVAVREGPTWTLQVQGARGSRPDPRPMADALASAGAPAATQAERRKEV